MSNSLWNVLTSISRIGAEYGLTSDQISAAQAVAVSEGGWDGSVGDNGTSFGVFQFHVGGQLDNFANWLGLSISDAGTRASSDYGTAIRFALRPGGYLSDALKAGSAAGYSGANLAYYASANGQRSATPSAARAAWDRVSGILLGGPAPGSPGSSTSPVPVTPSTILNGTTPTVAIVSPFTSLVDAIGAIPTTIATAINDASSFARWLGQPNLILRAFLAILGAVIVVVGIVLFALSFSPKSGLSLNSIARLAEAAA